jgi:hypothetical protein
VVAGPALSAADAAVGRSRAGLPPLELQSAAGLQGRGGGREGQWRLEWRLELGTKPGKPGAGKTKACWPGDYDD